ncbi:P-loop containing nucleoside triphosphate hydrolase protein [Mycena olivaceomarginata]|nr:P-loop containing nucleoside triphosphate hydrolase protein [Mycena olivaceomarginata]
MPKNPPTGHQTLPRSSKLPGNTSRKYKPEEIDLDLLAKKATEVLSAKPFQFQLEAAAAILHGEDLIIDVGTGAGKTLCFTLPLLLNTEDISMIVSPLSALMIDQGGFTFILSIYAASSKIPTVAVCSETLTRLGSDKVYEDIVLGKFRQVIVSPEIATSSAFRKAALSKPQFTSKLRCVGIDEAHCVSLWGGSFRPDYADLGLLRARFPSNVPFVVASATLPEHVLDDVCLKLGLSKDPARISLTNARPNIALSVRAMQFPEESRADLRFLIPPQASKPEHIPITLGYCNTRLAWRGCMRCECIAFYHAKIGQAQKRNLEERLRKGKIRILFCTDAVGMGCDMRNIERVVLWGLPPSFCALVQRAGRAMQNPKNRGTEEATDLALQGIEVTTGLEEVSVTGGGIRVSKDSDEEDGEPEEVKHKRRKKLSKDANSREARFLSRFAVTKKCRRKIWDEFFQNALKLQLVFPENTLYQPLRGERCCDNCEPRLFEVEKIKFDKLLALKRGRKKEMPSQLVDAIRNGLMDWREDYLLDQIYPDTVTISPSTVLGDDVIEQLTKERVETGIQLRRQTLWFLGFQNSTTDLTVHGSALLEKLQNIYDEYDAQVQAEEERIANLPPPATLTPAAFYGPPSTIRRTRSSVGAGTPLDGSGEGGSSASGYGTRARRGKRGSKVMRG